MITNRTGTPSCLISCAIASLSRVLHHTGEMLWWQDYCLNLNRDNIMCIREVRENKFKLRGTNHCTAVQIAMSWSADTTKNAIKFRNCGLAWTNGAQLSAGARSLLFFTMCRPAVGCDRPVIKRIDSKLLPRGRSDGNGDHLPHINRCGASSSRPSYTFMAGCLDTRTLSNEAQNDVGSNEHAPRHRVTCVTISLLLSSAITFTLTRQTGVRVVCFLIDKLESYYG
jgi:hypothetical protein